MVREHVLALLRFEVQSWLSRKGCDQRSDHRREQSQEGVVRQIFSVLPRLAETGLMGKGGERVDIGEEVVDEEIQSINGTD